MPPAERRALLLLLALAVLGQGIRHLATRPGDPPGQVQLLATLPAGSPLAQRDSAIRQARPLAPGERLDIDSASARELARLPRVGPALAKAIVADREEHGPFGSLEALDRVPGIGPGLLKALAPHVRGAGWQRDSGAVLPAEEFSGPAFALNLNSANEKELDALPGVGPARAAAIVQYREEHGPFTDVEELTRVPGFGISTLNRLRDRVSVR